VDASITSNHHLREMIRTELAKHHPVDVARNSLELLADTALVKPDGGRQPTEEAVRKKIAELRRKHPTLFKKVSEPNAASIDMPAPAGVPDVPSSGEPSSSQPIERDWIRFDAGSEASLRQPGTELQHAAPARAGRSFGMSFSTYAARVNELGHELAVKAREMGTAVRSRARNALSPMQLDSDRPTPPSRYVYAGVATALVLGLLGWMWTDSPREQSAAPPTAQTAKAAAPPPSSREPASTGAVSKRPADSASARTTTEPVRPLKGVPEVVDTATLRLEGKVVRLFGVEWARGGQAEDLTRYLRGREIECQLATAPDVYRCRVEAQDLSKVVLFNGGARATADATPELAAAENHAKAERLGVWRK
jgi:endonuclease YncB( thermonuclease family)